MMWSIAVDDLEDLISDLSLLDQYGNRLIEQQSNRLGTSSFRSSCYLKTANRIDFWPSVPRVSKSGWRRSKFWSYKDDKGLFEAYRNNSKRWSPAYWRMVSHLQWILWFRHVIKAIRRNQPDSCDRPPLWHLPQELLKVSAWQVTR